MFKYPPEEVAALSAIVTSLVYITIGLALAGVVGRALSRSGRAFLRTKFGGQDGVADAVDRLLVVAFYLLAAGFIALTVPTGAHIADGGQALRLLSVKLGELLLVLGALHLASTITFARLRGSRAAALLPAGEDAEFPSGPAAGPGDHAPAARSATAGPASARSATASTVAARAAAPRAAAARPVAARTAASGLQVTQPSPGPWRPRRTAH